MSDQQEQHKTTPTAVRVSCAMSGEREAMDVRMVGLFAVSFVFNDDASVIVRGDDLRQVRAIIDHQIRRQEKQDRANAAPF